jgi:hypothetical protein
MNVGRPLPNGRVGELVEILSDIEASDEGEDEGGAIDEES